VPSIGTQQSPINIHGADTLATTFPPRYFTVDYPDKALPGVFKGDNLEFSQFGKITYRGKKQKLLKIHIHRPSEHRVNGRRAAFECELVHFAADDADLTGPKVVIGVFSHKRAGADTPASIRHLSEKLRARKASKESPLRWRVDEKAKRSGSTRTTSCPRSATAGITIRVRSRREHSVKM
jgi:carbonic anhydrase